MRAENSVPGPERSARIWAYVGGGTKSLSNQLVDGGGIDCLEKLLRNLRVLTLVWDWVMRSSQVDGFFVGIDSCADEIVVHAPRSNNMVANYMQCNF